MSKFNIGSGDHKIDGFTNVDLHVEADVRDDIRVLSKIRNNSAREIYVAHALMYVEDGFLRQTLINIYDKLEKGGSLILEEPIDFENHWEVIYPRTSGDMIRAMEGVGFREIKETPLPQYSRHGKGYCLEGRK